MYISSEICNIDKDEIKTAYDALLRSKAEESRAVAASRAAAAAPVARRASSSGSPVKRKSINVINSDDWDANYSALKKYFEKNGNCKVPFGAETGNLRSWTERQKKMYASGKLDDDQLEKMNELDFDCECYVI